MGVICHESGKLLALAAALTLGLGACRAPASVPSQVPIPAPSPRVVSPPEWRPGDRWVYAWTAGADKGMKTVEMLETTELNGVRYYVVGDADTRHYWTLDLHWAAIVRDSKIEARMVPPLPWFVWPLDVGRRWAYRCVYEARSGRTESNDVFRVVGAEPVEVPAGRFQGLKIVRESHSRDSDQYWYVLEVRSYARWIGRRGDAQFEEQLVEYHAAPRLIPAPGSSTAPAPTK